MINISNLYHEAVNFTYENPPDSANFILGNYSRMAEMAEFYDYRFENYHIPVNLSVDTIFNDDECSDVYAYSFSDNCGQWTGLAITSWVFKYITATKENNNEMKLNATRVIRKLLTGMSYLLIVPNGGLGPEYGGILARSYVAPEHKSLHIVGNNPFEEDPRHFNGTGDYSQWRWRAFTSLDEFSGFYSGLALVVKFVQEPDIQDLAVIMIDQIASYMLSTNFLGVDWHGGLTGVDQKPKFFQGGTWICLLLKMAALAIPEKYEYLYYRYCAEEFYAFWTAESGEHESIMNYYAIAFGYHITFALVLLEDEPGSLRELYLAKCNERLWEFTKYHRNPFYNVIPLVCNENPGDNPILECDIEDQLMRYDCEYHFPDRQLGRKDVSEDTTYTISGNVQSFVDYLTNDPLGSLYLPFFEMVLNQQYYNKPLTVEYMPGNIFIWEKNPFVEQGSSQINPRKEYASFSFSLVYWIARAFGFFPSFGMRGA